MGYADRKSSKLAGSSLWSSVLSDGRPVNTLTPSSSLLSRAQRACCNSTSTSDSLKEQMMRERDTGLKQEHKQRSLHGYTAVQAFDKTFRIEFH